jgi:hypothetical protein
MLQMVALDVEVALHYVELMVNLRQSRGWLDHDQAVHPAGDVHRYHRGGAVLDVDAWAHRLEAERSVFAWRDLGECGSPTEAEDGVQIDAVGQPRIWRVPQCQFDSVAWRTRIMGPGTVPLNVQYS